MKSPLIYSAPALAITPLGGPAFAQIERRNPDDSLLDPKTVRRIGYSIPGKSVEPVNDLVAYYAELTGHSAVPTK